MGNTNQKASGELNNKKKKKSDDDNVVVKKWEQQLQLFKDKNPVLTMFTQFINKLQQQVELCLTKFGSNCQAVDPPPQKLPQQNKTNSLALWQVIFFFLIFFLILVCPLFQMHSVGLPNSDLI